MATFKTGHCHDKYLMLFWVTNASMMLMNLMNHIFTLCLDEFVVMFIDDILVYLRVRKSKLRFEDNFTDSVSRSCKRNKLSGSSD